MVGAGHRNMLDWTHFERNDQHGIEFYLFIFVALNFDFTFPNENTLNLFNLKVDGLG